ncbi:MAG: S41 family peptidase [Turicibacter sp.]|nr:S41 family peptidase [Turicibacter sp.]
MECILSKLRILNNRITIKRLIISLTMLLLSACNRTHHISDRPTNEYIEDLDYLYYIISNNWPFSDTAYRIRGVDFSALVAETRTYLESREQIRDDLEFWNILHSRIVEPITPIGHFGILDESFLKSSLSGLGALAHHGYPFLQTYIDVLDNTATRHFYRLTDNDFIFDDTAGDYQTTIQGNVTTDILEDGLIAYVRISTMSRSAMDSDGAILLDFFRQVADFEHLIIDIQSNPGGASAFFYDLVIAPNISEPLTVIYPWLVMAHDHNMMFLERYDFELTPVEEPFRNLNMRSYFETRIYPTHDGIFSGQIWLLVDGGTFSAAGSAASTSKYGGFATLVGQPTGSAGAGLDPFFLALPNTGIVFRYAPIYATDPEGRNFYEFGVSPHFYNMSNKNALETTLYLIRSRQS